MKFLFSLVLVLTASIALLTEHPAGAASSACAEVEAYIVTGDVAHSGDRVAAYIELHNCDERTRRFNMQFSITTACGEQVDIGSWKNSVLGGATVYAGAFYDVPAGACSGTYTLHSSVFSGNALLDQHDSTFTVE